MTRILLLGGTTEASALARLLAEAGIEAVFSYAGRTEAPRPQPLPQRLGGFGGAEGLAQFLRAERISHVVDATHPFAVQISRNALLACEASAVPLIALERAAWAPGPEDNWHSVPDTEAAVAALPQTPARVFLAIGRQTLAHFAAKPQHTYMLRLVDPPAEPLPLPDVQLVVARGPFTEAGDTELMRAHRITHLVAKNAGGSGAVAKLAAARVLGVAVIMIERPALPRRETLASPQAVLRRIAHGATPRGV